MITSLVKQWVGCKLLRRYFRFRNTGRDLLPAHQRCEKLLQVKLCLGLWHIHVLTKLTRTDLSEAVISF